jgi:hypothetical protein
MSMSDIEATNLRLENAALRDIIKAYEVADNVMNPPTQTKLESRIEVFANYFTGFIIAWVTWTLIVVGPMAWGWIGVEHGLVITMIFTGVSILRSYYWRRFFARDFHKIVHNFIKEKLGW